VSKKREEVMLADGRIFCLGQISGIVRKIDPLKNPSDSDLDDNDAVMYDELWETLVAENKARLEIIERWRFQLTDEWKTDDGGNFANRND
tara:strand:- start:301 stop:570 length:270 start_codon:yes stop_codon:yes gene_type:complete